MVLTGISTQSAQELSWLLQDAVCLFRFVVIKWEPKEAPASKYEVVVSPKAFSCSKVVFHWVQGEPHCSPDSACFQCIPPSQTEPEARTAQDFWRVKKTAKWCQREEGASRINVQAEGAGGTAKLTSTYYLPDHLLCISCHFLSADGPCGLRWTWVIL